MTSVTSYFVQAESNALKYISEKIWQQDWIPRRAQAWKNIYSSLLLWTHWFVLQGNTSCQELFWLASMLVIMERYPWIKLTLCQGSFADVLTFKVAFDTKILNDRKIAMPSLVYKENEQDRQPLRSTIPQQMSSTGIQIHSYHTQCGQKRVLTLYTDNSTKVDKWVGNFWNGRFTTF